VSKSEVRPDYYAYIADDEIDLRELAMILVRQWKLIVAVMACGGQRSRLDERVFHSADV